MKLRAALPAFLCLVALPGIAGAQETPPAPAMPDTEYCARRDADPQKCMIQDGPPNPNIIRKKPPPPPPPPPKKTSKPEKP
jgi:hypothetical protein